MENEEEFIKNLEEKLDGLDYKNMSDDEFKPVVKMNKLIEEFDRIKTNMVEIKKEIKEIKEIKFDDKSADKIISDYWIVKGNIDQDIEWDEKRISNTEREKDKEENDDIKKLLEIKINLLKQRIALLRDKKGVFIEKVNEADRFFIKEKYPTGKDFEAYFEENLPKMGHESGNDAGRLRQMIIAYLESAADIDEFIERSNYLKSNLEEINRVFETYEYPRGETIIDEFEKKMRDGTNGGSSERPSDSNGERT